MELLEISDLPLLKEAIKEYHELGHDQMELIVEGPTWWSDFKNGIKSGYKEETDRRNAIDLNKRADKLSLVDDEPEQKPKTPQNADDSIDYQPVGRSYTIKKGADTESNWNKLDQSTQVEYQRKYTQQINKFIEKNPKLRTKVMALLSAELKRKSL